MHWVLFACVAQRSRFAGSSKSETYDGETTLLLSRLFSAADITTLDLPEDDPVFAQVLRAVGSRGACGVRRAAGQEYCRAE